MNTAIIEAIALRKSGNYEGSRQVLSALLSHSGLRSIAHLHMAWSYDNEGKEQNAALHYERALQGTLPESDRFDAMFGLASTLRCLGKYDQALDYFKQTITEYPDAIEVQPFYAMCLYNLGRAHEAVSILLKLLLSTTDSGEIRQYQRAISLYAEDLNRKW